MLGFTILPSDITGESPVGVEIPCGFGFKAIEVSIAAIGGDESAGSVVDPGDAIVNEGVVSGEIEREIILGVAPSELGGEESLRVNVG